MRALILAAALPFPFCGLEVIELPREGRAEAAYDGEPLPDDACLISCFDWCLAEGEGH